MKYWTIPVNGLSLSMPYNCLYIYAHSISSSQSVGFEMMSRAPLGPARKNLHSPRSISLAPKRILVHSKKENKSLCLSNKERQTFLYRSKVNSKFKLLTLLVVSISSSPLDLFTDEPKSLWNHCSEY